MIDCVYLGRFTTILQVEIIIQFYKYNYAPKFSYMNTCFFLNSYPQTDVVIMCYNIASSTSLNNIKHKWIHEVREHIPNKPIMLGKILY